MQWSRYLQAEARRKGLEVLWLNLDESNISVVPKPRWGNIKRIPRKPHGFTHPKIHASSSEQKMSFTLVAIICTDQEIQRLLPQVIFIGKKHISLRWLRFIWGLLPNNVFVRRNPGKGWTTKEMHVTIVKMIGKVLEPFLTHYQPVLVFDALKIHLHPDVLEELFIWMLWYQVIPKELTGLLQPLDTHALRTFKNYLRRGFNNNFGTKP